MIDELLKSFITLFVIINPIGNVIIFMGLSHNISVKKRESAINQILIISTVLLFVFLFFGIKIFDFFSISISSFQIAGGIILLLMGVIYVLGVHIRHQSIDNEGLAVVPMSTPLLIGPGTITSAVLLVSQYGIWVVFISAVLVLSIVWLAFRFSTKLYRFMGSRWLIVTSRIMGLILASIAVEFIKKGLVGI